MSLYNFNKIKNGVSLSVDGAIMLLSSRKRINAENWTTQEGEFLKALIDLRESLDNIKENSQSSRKVEEVRHDASLHD